MGPRVVTRYTGGPEPSVLPGWATPYRQSLLGVLFTPVSFLVWLDIAFRHEPRRFWMPLGLFFSLVTVINYRWVFRTWKRERDAERDRIVRDVMES